MNEQTNESFSNNDGDDLEQNIEENDKFFTAPITKIETALAKARAELNKHIHDKRVYLAIAFICFFILIFDYLKYLNLSNWIQVILWIIGMLFLFAFWGTDLEEFKSKVESWQSLKKYYQGISGDEKKTYFDSLVQINVSNLDAYYSLVKVHTKRSFIFSAIVGFIGFGLILLGLVVSYLKPELKNITYIASSAGIITEFISGIFFYLYNKNIRQLKDYHDSLLDVQNILLSFKLIETTKNEDKRISMTDKM